MIDFHSAYCSTNECPKCPVRNQCGEFEGTNLKWFELLLLNTIGLPFIVMLFVFCVSFNAYVALRKLIKHEPIGVVK